MLYYPPFAALCFQQQAYLPYFNADCRAQSSDVKWYPISTSSFISLCTKCRSCDKVIAYGNSIIHSLFTSLSLSHVTFQEFNYAIELFSHKLWFLFSCPHRYRHRGTPLQALKSCTLSAHGGRAEASVPSHTRQQSVLFSTGAEVCLGAKGQGCITLWTYAFRDNHSTWASIQEDLKWDFTSEWKFCTLILNLTKDYFLLENAVNQKSCNVFCTFPPPNKYFNAPKHFYY